MTIGGMFESLKRCGYIADRKYETGDISEKTGLQKQPDGSWRVPKDKLEKPFETNSNGNVDFGIITSEQAEAMGTDTEAPIRLSLGDEKYGKLHISDKHRKELEQHGYKNVNDFVEDITSNFTQILQGNKTATRNTFLLVKKTSRGTLFIELEKTDNGNYYGVNSGGIFSQKYLEKHKPLWSATRSTDTASELDGSVSIRQTNDCSGYLTERTASKGLYTSLTQDKEIIKFFERYKNVFETVKEYTDKNTRKKAGSNSSIGAVDNYTAATSPKPTDTIARNAPEVKSIEGLWQMIKRL